MLNFAEFGIFCGTASGTIIVKSTGFPLIFDILRLQFGICWIPMGQHMVTNKMSVLGSIENE